MFSDNPFGRFLFLDDSQFIVDGSLSEEAWSNFIQHTHDALLGVSTNTFLDEINFVDIYTVIQFHAAEKKTKFASIG